MRVFILCLIALFVSSASLAQQTRAVSGGVVDSTGNPLADVSVNLKSSTENLSTKTNASGKYHGIKVSAAETGSTITIRGVENYAQAYTVGNKQGKAFI